MCCLNLLCSVSCVVRSNAFSRGILWDGTSDRHPYNCWGVNCVLVSSWFRYTREQQSPDAILSYTLMTGINGIFRLAKLLHKNLVKFMKLIKWRQHWKLNTNETMICTTEVLNILKVLIRVLQLLTNAFHLMTRSPMHHNAKLSRR